MFLTKLGNQLVDNLIDFASLFGIPQEIANIPARRRKMNVRLDLEWTYDANPERNAARTIDLIEDDDSASDLLASALAAIDVMLTRSDAALMEPRRPRPSAPASRDPLVYEADWDEEARLSEWRVVLGRIQDLPAILQAIIALDAWNRLMVSQHRGWLGRLLAAALLRQLGMTTAHLTAFNLGLKAIPVERRRNRDRDTRLTALLAGIQAAADLGFKDHHRLSLARQSLVRRLEGRRTSSNLPALGQADRNK